MYRDLVLSIFFSLISLIYIGFFLLIVAKIFTRKYLNEFIKINFPQAKDNPLTVTCFIVATILWIGVAGELIGTLPHIIVFDKWFDSSWYGGGPVSINPIFYSWYLMVVMVVVFFTAISGAFLSFQFGPPWAAWIFFLIAIIFNPWKHQYLGGYHEYSAGSSIYDTGNFIWFAIRGGVILWMCLAIFMVYKNTNKREGFLNNYPLVIPTGISIVSFFSLHLSLKINAEMCAGSHCLIYYDSLYTLYTFVKTVILSAALYGAVLSFMLGLKWVAVVFCLTVVFLISLPPLPHSFVIPLDEGFAILWLCFSSFLVSLDNKTIQPVLWKKEALLLWYQPLTISSIWSIGWLVSQIFAQKYTYVSNPYKPIIFADLIDNFIILIVVMTLFGILTGLVLKNTMTAIQRHQKIAVVTAWVIAIVIGEITIYFSGDSFFTNFPNSIFSGAVVVFLITKSVL